MNILNFEDNVIKHHDIRQALENGRIGSFTMDRADNLQEGLKLLEEKKEQQTPYDLVITDMWYPERRGEKDTNCGEKLIQLAQENGWNIPIILCSSISYRIPEILGTVYYSENEDWERELVCMVKGLKQ